ncbi:MAG: histidine phosphotransferase family protein, partial [Methylocystis sp.]
EDDKIGFKIEAKGVNARLAANVSTLLSGDAEEGAIDARAIQAYYTGLVAKACGLELSVSSENELVIFEARPVVAPGNIHLLDDDASSKSDSAQSAVA